MLLLRVLRCCNYLIQLIHPILRKMDMQSNKQQLWDTYSSTCEPDAEQAALLEELDCLVRSDGLSRKSAGGDGKVTPPLSSEQHEDAKSTVTTEGGRGSSLKVGEFSSYDGIHDSLHSVENACQSFISKLDSILGVLEQVEHAHSDVTGRTNILMLNCETLLEQQHTLQNVVDQLQDIITPFNDVEEVAGQLGIPVDATGRAYATHSGSSKTMTSLSSGKLSLSTPLLHVHRQLSLVVLPISTSCPWCSTSPLCS